MLDTQTIAANKQDDDSQVGDPTRYIEPFKPAALEVFKHYPTSSGAPLGAQSISQFLIEAAVTSSILSPQLYLLHTGQYPTPENVIGTYAWQGQALLPGHFTLGALCVVKSKRDQRWGSRLIDTAVNQIAKCIPSNLRSATVLLEQGGTSSPDFYRRLEFRPWRNNIMYRDVLNPKFAAE